MSAPNLPIVALVGRPNVGKSTLFNRYAGRRRSIVANQPGLTRDRIAEEIRVAERSVLLVDTAGLDPDPAADREGERKLGRAIQAQAAAAIEDADAILLIVDGQAGLLPEDEALARTLRRTSKPMALAINKIDVPSHEPRALEFLGLGFERVGSVSAEHGRGAWDLLEELVAALPDAEEIAETTFEGVRIALVGRPNVGKSSLTNRLLGRERVVVSEVPGTTRDAIDSRLERDGEIYTLVDTAGLRRPGRRVQVVERGSALMAVRAMERADVALVVLDAAEGFTDRDAGVASLARERGCAVGILANKWDLIPGERSEETLREIRRALRFMPDAPVLTVSALEGRGAGKILPTARTLARTAERRIGTGELNRWLREVVQRHEPAMAQRGSRKRPIKFFYATQTAVSPPTFVLFCTEPDSVRRSYRRFLENQLRESFGFAGAPLRLRLRARSDPRGASGR